MRSALAAAQSHAGWRPAGSARRPVLLVNPRSGDGEGMSTALVEGARERAIDVRLLGEGESLAALADDNVEGGADALGVAGGDGSLAVVAARARSHDLPFVCVPGGHAQPLRARPGRRPGRPGRRARRVHGRPRTQDRRAERRRSSLPQQRLGRLLRRGGPAAGLPRREGANAARDGGPGARPSKAGPELRLVDDRGNLHRDPAVVLVSNNSYALERPLVHGTRPLLDGGRLGVLVLHRPLADVTPARAWTAMSLAVDAPATVHAGIDGEAVELS